MQPNIYSGVTAGPVWNQGQVDQAAGAFKKFGGLPVNYGGMTVGRGALNDMWQGGMNSAAHMGETAFRRHADEVNANQQMASQMAQSQAGLGWANLANRQGQANLSANSRNFGSVMSLLQALGLEGGTSAADYQPYIPHLQNGWRWPTNQAGTPTAGGGSRGDGSLTWNGSNYA